MRGAPLEETEGGSKCILCGHLNPSENHLRAHKTQKCGEGAQGSFSCKRRTDLVKHLKKCHGVQEKTLGEAIADKWKETAKKQAWSCGFCSHLFRTFGDRLKHIATHFERGQTLDEWDVTKVMKGLLSQPEMVNAWKAQWPSSLGWASLEVVWKKHAVKGLQHNLEIGPSDSNHAVALAKAAYEACQPSGHSLNGDEPITFAPIGGALGTSVVVPTSDYDSMTERESKSNPNHDQPHFVANPAETLHTGIPASDGVPMTTYEHVNFLVSSDGGSRSIQAPWPLVPGEPWTSAADQYIDSNGYQEHSNANAGNYSWPTPPMFGDEPDTDDVLW